MKRARASWCAAIGLLVLLLSAAGLRAQATPPAHSRDIAPAHSRDVAPTYSRDVAPILYSQCASCHRPGEVAPFALLSYEDARRRARQLADVTAQRVMPPWKPVPGYGEFQHARVLTAGQVRTLSQWAMSGAAQGNPADAPAPPHFTDG